MIDKAGRKPVSFTIGIDIQVVEQIYIPARVTKISYFWGDQNQRVT